MRSRVRAATNTVFRRVKSSPSAASFIASLSPAAWYRYGQGITSSGGLVSAWADQSGNGRHLVQATGTNQPSVTDDGTITFDGVDNFLRVQFTFNQPMSAYMVFKPNAAGANAPILSGAINGTAFAYFRWNAGALQIVMAAPTAVGAIPTTTGSWLADAAILNTTDSIHIRYDGEVDTGNNIGANNAGGITLGAHQTTVPTAFGSFSVREIILFSGAQSTDTAQQVLQYLAPMRN